MDKTMAFEGFQEVEELDLLGIARKIREHCRVRCYCDGCMFYRAGKDDGDIELYCDLNYPMTWDLPEEEEA